MHPIEIPASELPVCELTDMELDVVSGGFIGINNGEQVAVPVVIGNFIGGGLGGSSNVANVIQSMNQANFSAGFLQF
jgi:hypothetical protein